ncbi:MAG: pyridoxal phosphate-dependent aminotransferase [Lachnospiraceae bacterium]|nr:pyridoxal phosphate-dependent aminotransferase [Lachnospiraceae bacterium]
MKYDFDKITNRQGTGCIKYDFPEAFGRPKDVLPMWVADMDFPTAQGIIDRLTERVSHGIFGYSDSDDAYFSAVYNWYKNNFDWEVKKEWLVKTPGVVFALAAAVRAFTKEGDAIMIQQPVYYPFAKVIENNRRILINNPLQLVDGHYEMDFADMEEKIVKHQVKLLILCSPHNPVGRVWKEWELQKVGEICQKYDVKIVSDEIHSDFTYPGHKHHVFTTISKNFEDISMVCTAPSKTFNLAGLQISNIFIANPKMKQAFLRAIDEVGYEEVNVMGMTACQAAYEEGGEWLTQLKEYLCENLAYIRTYLAENLPQIKLIEPEGTYLVWLDCSALGMSGEERDKFMLQDAKIWLDTGAMFGADGENFERVNITCPRAVLKQALEQLKAACDKLNA